MGGRGLLSGDSGFREVALEAEGWVELAGVGGYVASDCFYVYACALHVGDGVVPAVAVFAAVGEEEAGA